MQLEGEDSGSVEDGVDDSFDDSFVDVLESGEKLGDSLHTLPLLSVVESHSGGAVVHLCFHHRCE